MELYDAISADVQSASSGRSLFLKKSYSVSSKRLCSLQATPTRNTGSLSCCATRTIAVVDSLGARDLKDPQAIEALVASFSEAAKDVYRRALGIKELFDFVLEWMFRKR